ncbi:CRISPR-associated protein [[Pantoea] beijingensis]|uniref:CRISPR-associated protein n=1 Tax=[Pantoea] beijingensis TaxID=1324864 RepID=A0A443I8Z0_9GAMM|nr:type I-F CRISPR-associated protein Csy1 [[Pantoea] beijingensis]RWR00503.1 CRISPR-associated protein [[Pantoea] beijingensis]
MPEAELINYIVDFIAGRRQAKLEAFDKEARKRLASVEAEESDVLQQALLQQRTVLEDRYTPGNWLTDAANRAGQISLVTHAAKYTHGDSKSSSVYSQITNNEGYVSTASLRNTVVDAVGNAAMLDVAKLLQMEHDGDSLLACLQRKDYRVLEALAEDPQQLEQWITGFNQALTPHQPASHKLAKQVYFPVGDGYHLLSPLFSSALAQALYQRIIDARFSEGSKAARQARRDGEWCAEPVVYFPATAIMNFGGTNSQNISLLNSRRGGRVFLLSAQPPLWKGREKPPLGMKTLFGHRGPFDHLARNVISQLSHLLTRQENNHHIRTQRDRYIDELIDLLFTVAADIQREAWCGWTKDPHCQLKAIQRLWLDPWRSKEDVQFRAERDKDEWKNVVADDFALWLNGHLNMSGLDVGQSERSEWKMRPLFKQRLREMDAMIKEGMR